MKLMSPRETTGNITVKDRAIAEIVGIAALRVPGVVALRGNPLEQFIEVVWKSLPYTGVRIFLNEREIRVTLSIAVAFGSNVGEVASQVQEKIREAVESMTGHVVGDIHVTIVQVRQTDS